MAEIWELTLSEGLEKIGAGELGAAGWTRALLGRIDALEEKTEAWAWLDREGALEAAEKIDSAISAGENPGPLAGAPIGVKDIIDVRGLLCEAHSPILKGNIPAKDAFCIAGLREAGAVILGKTVTTQFATGDPSETRNPWNLAHSPGGSSSGSAAAVASGMAPAALGSQTGGSVLRPSAYCGVVGFKPTYGLISRSGVVEVSWTLDHIGTITRSAEDAARLLAGLAGEDEADETTRLPGEDGRPGRPDLSAKLSPRKPLKGRYPRAGIHKYAAPEVSEWTDRGVEALRGAGVEVEEIEFPLDFQKLHDAHRMIMNVEGASYHEKNFAERPDDYQPVIRALNENGLKTRGIDYHRGLRQRGRLIADVEKVLAGCDFIVLPTFQAPPPPWEESTGNAFFNEPATQTGLPALTLPLGRGDNNLPFGIQVIGRRMGDLDLLAAAGWCEAELGWRPEIAGR